MSKFKAPDLIEELRKIKWIKEKYINVFNSLDSDYINILKNNWEIHRDYHNYDIEDYFFNSLLKDDRFMLEVDKYERSEKINEILNEK